MLWTIFVIRLVLWLLGLVSSYTLGGVIHILLVIAIVVLIIPLISGRRALYRRSDEAGRNYRHHSYRYRHHRARVWRDHVHQARKGARSRPHSGDCGKTKDHPVSAHFGRDLFGRRNRAGDRRQPDSVERNQKRCSRLAVSRRSPCRYTATQRRGGSSL